MPGQEQQLQGLHERAREHNVAQAQVTTRAHDRARRLAALAAVFALLSGAAWGRLAGSFLSDQTAELIAAFAAFAAAAVSAVVAAMHWDDATETEAHLAMSDEWGGYDVKVMRAMWRMAGGEEVTEEQYATLLTEFKELEKEEREKADIREPELIHASNWLHKYRADTYAAPVHG